MTTIKQIWSGPKELLEQASIILTEVLFPPADAISLIKKDPTTTDEDSSWALHAYFDPAPDQKAIDQAFASLDIHLPAPMEEDLPDQDWVAHSLAGLGVVQAGAFVLFGRHDAQRAQEYDGLMLQIEANRAFGTGHHPTTVGCLSALTRLREMDPSKVLDVGTGSGVLAIAARKLWPEAEVFGTDIDEPSVGIAAENAEIDQAPDISFQMADGLGAFAGEHGPFDLILANILADPLIGLAPEVAASLAAKGKIVLAGLLTRQEEAVLNAYQQRGLSLVDRINDDTWPVLILGH